MQHEQDRPTAPEAPSQEPGSPEREGLFARQFNATEDRWELWAIIGVVMLGLQLTAWIVVFLRLGPPSVFAHAMVVALLGTLTLPITLWGLIKSMFNLPVLRRSRTIGFVSLVIVGLLGNVPMFAPPLSTEDFTSTHRYRLPFEGEWTTIAGGEERETNYHATTAALRWGYDFVPLEDGRRFSGQGATLDEHHCFGRPVLAPVGGKVVAAVASEPDNTPGRLEGTSLLGNHVVIEVDRGEYLFVTHMRKDSIPVKVGASVAPGERIGECGNSGHTLTPHVHVHLQNSPDFPYAEGMPLRFSNYVADGQAVELGMPRGSRDPENLTGQLVRNAD